MSSLIPSALLRRASRRHLLRRPWLAGLTIAGVALAVAVVVGIDLANASAERAFRLSIDDVAGRATHQVFGGPQGLEEAVYADLRGSGLPYSRASAPVVEGRGRIGEHSVRVLGLDPWADRPVRAMTGDLAANKKALNIFLSQPGAILLGRELADTLGVSLGDRLPFQALARDAHAEATELTVVAITTPDGEAMDRAWRDLVVVDVATAQEILGRGPFLDRIDLVLPEGADEPIADLLPSSAELRRAGARGGALEEMTRAFRLNLSALSMLALLVGMFLIYNAMSFLVVERRPLLGRFRALGVEKRQILFLVLAEAAAIGTVGSLMGLVLGQALARGLLRLISRTINDLYFVVTVQDVAQPLGSLILGAALGLIGSLLAALGPALEASRVQPQTAMRRSAVEQGRRRSAPRLAWAGLAAGIVAALLIALPGRSLGLGFAAVFIATLGFAAVIPLATLWGSRALAIPAGRFFGNLGKMAARDVASSLSRTGIAVAALTIAVATTIGVAIMVSSFRATLVDWLEITLRADLYASSVHQDGRGQGPPLDPRHIEALSSHPRVAHVSTYRRVEVTSSRGPTQLHALHAEAPAFEVFSFSDPVSRDEVYRRFRAGQGILISEPYAYRHNLKIGDSLDLRTDRGRQDFEVLAVFYDYASDRGLVMIDDGQYRKLWNDPHIQSVGLYLRDGADADAVAADLKAQIPVDQVGLVANRELRRLSLDIFDRTFRITDVLRWLAVTVAFFGVLSALMALQLERGRELAVLRAMGMEPTQVKRLLAAQNALLGALAGVLAAPLGIAMASMLVHVINKRSFGWTLKLTVEPTPLIQGLMIAVLAALLAGWIPARRMAGQQPARGLREE